MKWINVGIKKCENCGRKFKYKFLLKSVFTKSTLNCASCGKAHKVALINRAIFILLIILPAFILIWSEALRESIRMLPSLGSAIFIFLVYVAIIIALSPYMFKYKLKENSRNKR